MSDVCQSTRIISKPFSVAGQNVLLAYLLSEMLPSPFGLIHFDAEPGLAWHVFRCAALGGSAAGTDGVAELPRHPVEAGSGLKNAFGFGLVNAVNSRATEVNGEEKPAVICLI